MRTFATAGLFAVALVACSSLPFGGGPHIADGSTFSMRPGATVTLADHTRLQYLRLASDSRCPPQVHCIWAGDAELLLQWRSPTGAMQAFSLHPGRGDSTRVLGQRTLSLPATLKGRQEAAIHARTSKRRPRPPARRENSATFSVCDVP